jgi:(S)-mandelate dehydrogenase
LTAANRHTSLAQLGGSPRRRFYTGGNLERAVAIADLRARTHKLMPRFVLEYLEGGAEDEATLYREREAFAEWRFMPHTLVDESHRSLQRDILGRPADMPLIVAPTGLNGLFRHKADVLLAEGAARANLPFVQSTMSTDPMQDVAKVGGLRHWWQLYVFGGDEIWQELLRRADTAGCEALVLTTNSQIFGNREWDSRTRATRSRPSLATIFDAALHGRWLAGTLAMHGMPVFANVVDFVPKADRGFFRSAFWIRDQMPRSLSWDTVAKIRARWKKAFFIKGILNLDDVRLAMDAGVDGVMLGSHGGRQMDWAVSALDILEDARRLIDGKMALYMSGGIRRGNDMLKALALGADAVLTGRATLYGLCAGGADGVARALAILKEEATNDLGQLGVSSLDSLGRDILVRQSGLPLPPDHPAG